MVPASGDRRKRGKALRTRFQPRWKRSKKCIRSKTPSNGWPGEWWVGAPAVQPHRRSEPQPEPEVDEGSDPSELARLATPELYARLRHESRAVGQVLGLEVAAFDHRTSSTICVCSPLCARLLPCWSRPCCAWCDVDQRFFSDKGWPARRLLDTIATRKRRLRLRGQPGFCRLLSAPAPGGAGIGACSHRKRRTLCADA